MKRGRLDVSKWVMQVLCWDGLLPVIMLLLPWVIGRLDAGANEWFEFLPILICIAGIFVRLYSGIRIISRNDLTPGEQQGQRFFLLFGAMILAVIETSILAIATLPAAMRPQPDKKEVIILSWLYLAYLICLTIAMYPGRKPIIEDGSEPLLHESDSESPRL